MSTIVMSKCWLLGGMSPAQKTVLISLADQANDDGYCWPAVSTIATRTCLSERAVQGAIRWLKSAGILTSSERRGTSTVYQLTPAAYAPPQMLHPRSICTPADAAPPQMLHPTPAASAPPPPQMLHPTPADAAPKPSMNHQLNRKEERDTRMRAPTFSLPDWINRLHWDAWHSCDKRKKATDAQKQMAVEKLDGWRRSGIDHAAALENAAIAGWQGLFKPNEQGGGQAARTSETAYQRSMRERMEQVAPSVARKAPGDCRHAVDDFRTIDTQARVVADVQTLEVKS